MNGWYRLSALTLLAACASISLLAALPPKKPHAVTLGGVKKVPYSIVGDPAGAAADEKILKTRPLLVDGRLGEWTTGEAHDLTDRSFVVRRALRINDLLPNDKTPGEHWVWQRGPWLMVDRMTGHVTALKLPDYDPGASHVTWFRDYAAYCGLTSSGKGLYAVVAQVGARKPVLAKKIAAYDPNSLSGSGLGPVCGAPDWQREPLRVSFHPTGVEQPVTFNLVAGSAVLVEDGDETEAKEPEIKASEIKNADTKQVPGAENIPPG